MVCSRSAHGIYHSRYLGLKGLIQKVVFLNRNNSEIDGDVWIEDYYWYMYIQDLFSHEGLFHYLYIYCIMPIHRFIPIKQV